MSADLPTRDGRGEGAGAGAGGYRVQPGHGPRVRSDVVDVYVFRRGASAGPGAMNIELLQLQRAREPLRSTWQPVMGHIEPGETAPSAALRELREEVGLNEGETAFVAMWALEQVHPFYIAAIDCIVLSPRFVVETAAGWEPGLNAEHSAHRWVAAADAKRCFMWPGQKAAIDEITSEIVGAGTPALARERLRLR